MKYQRPEGKYVLIRVNGIYSREIDAYMGADAVCTVMASNTSGTIVNENVCGDGKHPDLPAFTSRI